MTDQTPCFGCTGVYLSLGGRQILKDVSLSVQSGELLGLIGPNGAGKTSLFEVLSGRYHAQQGDVRLDGKSLAGLDIFRRARLGMARTYQSPVVPNALTVGETFRAARKAYAPYMSVHDAEWARGWCISKCPGTGFRLARHLRSPQVAAGLPDDAATACAVDGRACLRPDQHRDIRTR